jgi:hypothetical protein
VVAVYNIGLLFSITLMWRLADTLVWAAGRQIRRDVHETGGSPSSITGF